MLVVSFLFIWKVKKINDWCDIKSEKCFKVNFYFFCFFWEVKIKRRERKLVIKHTHCQHVVGEDREESGIWSLRNDGVKCKHLHKTLISLALRDVVWLKNTVMKSGPSVFLNDDVMLLFLHDVSWIHDSLLRMSIIWEVYIGLRFLIIGQLFKL